MVNSTPKIYDYKEECRIYMASVGLHLDALLLPNGKIQRYSADAKKNQPDEYYVAHEGFTSQGQDYLYCTFGSWSDGSQYKYSSENSKNYCAEERREIREKQKVHFQSVQANLDRLHADGAKKAQELWEGYSKEPSTKEFLQYVEHKGIQPLGDVRFGLNPSGFPSLILPIRNVENEIRSLQYISFDSQNNKSYKTFLSGGEIKGNFFTIGDISNDVTTVYLVEGYATGVSVYLATVHPVVIAFSAGNLRNVIENLVQKYPHIFFIIASDSDDTGKKKASEAASNFGCTVISPIFPKDKLQEKYTDFNDLHQACGIEEVKKQLLSASVITESIFEDQKKLADKFLARIEEPCEKFSLSKLPRPLGIYIASLCKATNAHPIMISASVLTMVSAYLGTKVCIAEGEYFQNLYPNLWILCIAKSGQFKTTALNKGAKIAFNNQAVIFRAIRELRAGNTSNDLDIEKQIMEKSRENVVLPTKTTAEAFLEYLAQGHQGAVFVSEFGGWLQNLDKSHNNDFKALLTDFYDVPIYYRYKTKTQGDCIIENPYMSICGVSTMTWVSSNIKPSDVPSGFLARFLLFAPPYQEEIPPALPTHGAGDHIPQEEDFARHLKEILNHVGDHRSYILSEKARIFFGKCHLHIYSIPQLYSDRAEEILQPYLKRWSPYLLKLAMIMQLFIDPEAEEISSEAIAVGFHILTSAMNSTAALFEKDLGESRHQRKCREIFEWLCKKIQETGNPVKRHTIISSKKLDGGSKDYDDILQTLIDQRKIECTESSRKNESEYSIVGKIEAD